MASPRTALSFAITRFRSMITANKKESLTMNGHPSSVVTAAVFDTKPYDREALQRASASHGIEWHFLDFRLTQDTASAAQNARAVCVFVNDELNRPCLAVLATQE